MASSQDEVDAAFGTKHGNKAELQFLSWSKPLKPRSASLAWILSCQKYIHQQAHIYTEEKTHDSALPSTLPDQLHITLIARGVRHLGPIQNAHLLNLYLHWAHSSSSWILGQITANHLVLPFHKSQGKSNALQSELGTRFWSKCQQRTPLLESTTKSNTPVWPNVEYSRPQC